MFRILVTDTLSTNMLKTLRPATYIDVHIRKSSHIAQVYKFTYTTMHTKAYPNHDIPIQKTHVKFQLKDRSIYVALMGKAFTNVSKRQKTPIPILDNVLFI
ncbi:hypothetical protein N7450_009894 [Penicillium hetheringtonii]|uniref:Uncharacterized protein n=1 Tax=Penicillium hetheringtonii TaxID=911720 RepID=A0AAD6DDY4_9EURO|nr:hypothetical protein N7450_009894 [Penicillium hetheringtonii]